MKLTRKTNGNIVFLPREPRGTWLAGAFLLGLITVLLFINAGAPELPRAQGYAAGFATLGLFTWSAWKAVVVTPLELDCANRCVRRGTQRPLLFSEIENIEISESWNDAQGMVSWFYVVSLRLSNGRSLHLGQADAVDEAAGVAKNIASLMDKPIITVSVDQVPGSKSG